MDGRHGNPDASETTKRLTLTSGHAADTVPEVHQVKPVVLALDFDGVLCDGRREYFETAWRAYARCWSASALSPDRRAALASEFSSLRPLVESGWEFPLLVHALLNGIQVPAPDDRAAWLAATQRLAAEAGLSTETLKQQVNEVRDDWFAADPAGWLAHHDFYPGVVERVERALSDGIVPVIVTTKAERFVRALLATHGERLATLSIMGWEAQRIVPKDECLRRLIAAHALEADGAGIWFVEDMLETLEKIDRARPPLGGVKRLLAEWGYNTPAQRRRARDGGHIHVIDLARFDGDFSGWL